jgi:hypothetical protein
MRFRVIFYVIFLSLLSTKLFGQATCTINPGGASVNWSACVCQETGLAPVNGNKVVVAASKTLVINVAGTPFFTGDIEVFGSLVADQANTQLNGNIRIRSGGTFDLAKRMNLGSAGGCGYTLVVDPGGTLTTSGGGASSLLSVCGTGVLQAGGGCGTYPTGSLPFCTPGGGWPTTGISFDETGNAGRIYTWVGTTANFNTSTNWTPNRTTLTTDDILILNASGSIKNITSVPTQSVGRIQVTGSSTYSFASSGSIILSLTNVNTATIGPALQIDNGSTLTIGTVGNPVNITMSSTSTTEISGQLNLFNGNLNVSGATLTLLTNSSPLARTGGQVSTDASTNLNFGNASNTVGATIVLPSSIFVASPTSVATLTVNRTNGATLSDQTILVSSSATFTLGVLNTNGSGRIRLGTAATNPTETSASYINGYAEMALRSVGTAAYDFLGFSLAAGADIGSVLLERRTGSVGINTFNSNQSIASTWVITNTVNNSRNVVFRWVAPLDNVTISSNQFQVYRFASGPGWTTVGPLALLTVTTPRRQTASVTASTLNNTFTVTDQSQVLPITLIDFGGSQWNESIRLRWETASEKNFDYFLVEKSLDGKAFTAISNVPGKGSSNMGANYLLDDEKPLIGKNYYRLHAVDLDGTEEFFDIILVNYSTEKNFELYPNPVTESSITAKINFVDFSFCTLIIYDQMGQVIHSSALDSSETEFTLSNELVNGVYFARLTSPAFTKTVRFLVLR